ncbi:MAG: kinase-regulated stress-responsive transcription factor skn7 [Chrysothrix sp. TS-e1954]|nr:MAG: kinase-regulated stress-responsive transcription factor skn7 [Chrysothrix sp. TS-e1954]
MDGPGGQGASAASSSDFVRKLYKMLEDPSYDSVVRWGNEGDSFVVLENERFTKSILPKHFKHSNFASFVRQLNKYDFHKVRHSNEEGGQSSYGIGAWEFKHPDFKANDKNALDNIRRKAPVPRKPNQTPEEVVPTQQMDLVNTQLVATQQQLQQLQEKYNELSSFHTMLLQEVIGLQKTVVNHEHVIQNVMNFLHNVDATQRRNSRALANPFAQSDSDQTNGSSSLGNNHSTPGGDEPASPLQHASKLLHDLTADTMINSRNLEQMNEAIPKINGMPDATTPSDQTGRSARPSSRDPPHSASSSSTMRYGDLDSMVYPVGQSNGIDPMYSEHINNIPYPMPTKSVETADARYQATAQTRKKNTIDLGWMRQPQILLVEDDPTCRRIGTKFLLAFQCSIDSAFDGLEAVNKLNSGAKYDLILMDIIMPNLDGVSACHLIRQFDSTPIIAMTSNIRSDDISMYFSHGMNDVLPKPFTKEGLMLLLDKHLNDLKKSSHQHQPHHSDNNNMLSASIPTHHSSTHHSVKEEDSPTSPHSYTANWHSPSAPMSGISAPDDYMHRGSYGMDSSAMPQHYASGPHTPLPQPHASHRRQLSEISGGAAPASGEVKRQQMYPGQGGMRGARDG